MNKATHTALEGSIKKWEDIEAGKIEDLGSKNCPLCRLFKVRVTCGRCPVRMSTNLDECDGSPYGKWSDYQRLRESNGNRNAFWATDKRSKKLAGDELAFLISLRVE